MKTEITYICEICDKDFDNEIDALKCEKHHTEVDEIDYFYCDGNRYPHKINIRFKDKTILEYITTDVSVAKEKEERKLDVIVWKDNATTILSCPNLLCDFKVQGDCWGKDNCPKCGQMTNRY